MKNSLIMKSHRIAEHANLEDMQQLLEIIEQKLESEILAKQHTISRQEQEIMHLHRQIEGKDKIILETAKKLVECTNNNEGNRQLINKLLGDIDRLRQDLDWYERTFEKRSLAGVIKDRFKFYFRK